MASIGCVIAAGVNLFAYSPWGDPQALTYGIQLLGVALLLAAYPAVLVVIWLVRGYRRAVRQSGLSPFQVALIETAGLEVLHHEMHKRNVATSARLTESVMGPERTGTWGE